MKKVFVSMVAIALVMATLVGCKGGGANDPKSVAQSFMDALKKKDFDGAAKYATKESKSALDMMKSAMKMAEAMGGKGDDMDLDKQWKGKKVEYGEPKITGDAATVSLTVDGKEDMPISLKKEDGAWRVAFDKSTLMKTGTEKLKESGNDLDHTMQGADSTLKELNSTLDSAKAAH